MQKADAAEMPVDLSVFEAVPSKRKVCLPPSSGHRRRHGKKCLLPPKADHSALWTAAPKTDIHLIWLAKSLRLQNCCSGYCLWFGLLPPSR